ncbi:MAG: hypothetical protein FJY29_04445 [Betaproteobacteria bacterium]|nr:hypothetical protein [Betaproteobacteria bacterium]
MSKHSNKLQKWISRNEQQEIERLILELEQKFPLEVVVAFTDKPALVSFAAARMIALLAVAAELIAEAFWIPVPAWLLGLVVFFALLLPTSAWQSAWIFRLLRFKHERQQGVMLQAEKCFSDLGLARTKARNALLVFFNMKERIFLLRPDNTLATEWPELKMAELVDDVGQAMSSNASAASASLQLLEKLRKLGTLRWPEAQALPSANELPNGVAWWQD